MPQRSTSAQRSGESRSDSTRTTREPIEIVVTSAERDAQAMRWEGEHGTAQAALKALAGKHIRLHKRAQAAEGEAEDLRKLVPPTGAVVLTGDEAKAYGELKAAGTTLDKVPGLLKSASELSATVALTQRRTDVKTAAGTKYKANVLAKLLGDSQDGKVTGVPIQFKTTMVRDGEGNVTEEQVPYVKVGDTLELLDTYAEREFKDWMDVLKAPEGDGTTETTPKPTTTPAGTSTPMIKQTSSTPSKTTPAAKGNVAAVGKILDAKYNNLPSQRNKDAGKT